jgi:hypothetical protein
MNKHLINSIHVEMTFYFRCDRRWSRERAVEDVLPESANRGESLLRQALLIVTRGEFERVSVGSSV